MSLEEAIKANTAAVEALTAQLKAGGSAPAPAAAPAPAKEKSTKVKEGAAAAAKPKHSREEMVAAVVKVKDDFGKPEAEALIKKYSPDTGKIADVKDESIDALYDAAVARHEELSNAGSSDDDI